MRRPVIAGNWKMSKTTLEAVSLANELKKHLYDIDKVDIVICPPFTALSKVACVLDGSNISLGAQNMYFVKEGAFTGEISPLMLKDVGCQFVFIGHSERRQYFGETNESVNQKVKSALEFGLTPIVCVGERLEERRANQTLKVVEDHVKCCLKGLAAEDVLNIIIGYEPVWAIGTGHTATPNEAQEVHAFIRSLLKDTYGKEVSSAVRIEYGGSVRPDNIAELMRHPDIDGGLVGRLSLKPKSFVQIVKNSLASFLKKSSYFLHDE